MSELKPCECGRLPGIMRQKPWKEGRFHVEAVWIECVPCGARGSTYAAADEAEALAAWNRRAPSAEAEMRERAAGVADAAGNRSRGLAGKRVASNAAAAIRALPLAGERE